ncbi:Nex18 symbiotically induced protein [Blastopirellula marina]|uniref:Nex18 symbiotically induced protein n=1 Tax=Blastopirellula marina TaxID=124 RepID=A0A2S8G3H7_9BACT|nr:MULTISPECIES: fasciclin domain-containing protein [Pirellulaceae]PQO39009.1 Nex18 symbiotically induced protein [Blastopirellula marina]RCS55317.1 fasciclin domain-containing protein [Bremerella cremea]
MAFPKIALAALCSLVLVCSTSFAADAKKDIVDTAVEAGSFKTLVAAVSEADLVATLKSKGPFTVFAPTDEAFAALPEGTVQALLKPENKEKLVKILTYHVVPGKVMAKDAMKLKEAKTVEGSTIDVQVKDGSVMIDEAKVVKANIVTSNGVIHVIDKVIMP